MKATLLGMKILAPDEQFKKTVRDLYARDCRQHKSLIDPIQLAGEATARLGFADDPERWKKLAVQACRELYVAEQRKVERRFRTKARAR